MCSEFLLAEKLLILIIIQQNIITNARRPSCKVLINLLRFQ